jgi:hypothetical protein
MASVFCLSTSRMHLPRRRFLIGGIVACAFIALLGYGIVEPQTTVGHVTFCVAYAFPPTRPTILRFYHWEFAEFNGGYIPTSIDKFLANRLRQCGGTREWTGILDFHLAQTSWRWGNAITLTDDQTKGSIISDLMRRSEESPPDSAIRMLLLVESLRRGTSFSKAGFMKPGVPIEPLYPLIRERYKAWWADGSSWPANKTADPLNDTGIIVPAP